MAKPKPLDLNRLCGAIASSRKVLEVYRRERTEAVRQYAGGHWSMEGARESVPVNLISLYVQIVVRGLIAKAPRVMLSTFQKQNKPMVGAMETWANKEIETINLADTLQKFVLDALFSVGIMKVALATPSESVLFGNKLPVGSPFASRVDLDDFFFDTHARDFSEVGFIGHRYRVPLETIRDDRILYKAGRKDLTASIDPQINETGDERISMLGRGAYGRDTEEYEDFVDLAEVYCPRHGCVYTFAYDQIAGATGSGTGGTFEALREQEWIGPDHGPYTMLRFGYVPNNAMPKGPIQDLIDLHTVTNNLYRKIIRQAQNQKECTFVQGGAMEDGSRVMEANDGDVLRVDNPEKIKTVSMRGANQQTVAMALHMKGLFAYMAGNLDMMGGLSPQSKTLGQDQMLEQNANGGIADKQDRTVTAVREVLKNLCWFWFHDPFKTMRTNVALPGMPNMQLARKVTPEQRMSANWADLEIKIDVYSMQMATPQGRLQLLNNVMQQIVIPTMGLLEKQGIAVDMNAYLDKVATYGDMPDLGEILTIQEPAEQQSSTGADPQTPAQTTRTYERTSMPGRTPAGDEKNMVNSLMGIDPGGNPDGNGEVAA